MSSFGNNFFCLKPNYCCLRNTLSCWLTPNLSLKITACVFTEFYIIFFHASAVNRTNVFIFIYRQIIFFFYADKSFNHFHSLHFLSSSHTFFSFIIVSNSSWLISMSISAGGIKVSMLLSLLLSIIRILSCFFFLFFVMLSNFFIIPVVREKNKVNLLLLFQLVLQQHLHKK